MKRGSEADHDGKEQKSIHGKKKKACYLHTSYPKAQRDPLILQWGAILSGMHNIAHFYHKHIKWIDAR